MKGIDGKGKIFIIPYQDLGAVVSQIDLEEFESDEIQRKAKEDLNWIKEKAQIHEEVIEEAMAEGSVIPMQFGVVFKNIRSLKQKLANYYEQFKKSLKKLAGKQEWGVRVFLQNEIFKKVIENKDRAVLAEKQKITSMPKGMAFFCPKAS